MAVVHLQRMSHPVLVCLDHRRGGGSGSGVRGQVWPQGVAVVQFECDRNQRTNPAAARQTRQRRLKVTKR